MEGKYTKRIEQLLKERGRSWRSLGFASNTLMNCKKKDIYTVAQIERIVESLGITMLDFFDFDNRIADFEKTHEQLKKINEFLNKTL